MRVGFEGEIERVRVAVWLATAVLAAAIAYVAWRYVGTVVLGVFVYYVTRPVFQRLDARLGSRTLAVVTALVTVSLPALGLVAWTLVIAVGQFSRAFGADVPVELDGLLGPYASATTITSGLEATLRRVLNDPRQLLALDLERFLAPVIDAVAASFGTLVNVGLHLFITLVIAFYLLRDDYRIAQWGRSTFVSEGGVTEAYLSAMDRDLKNVYFGNVLNALATGILGVVVYVTLNLFAPETVRVPEPVLVGLLVGVGSLVPLIGMKIVWVPLAVVLFVDALVTDPETLWFPTAFALVSVAIVDYIPDQLLRPYVSGRSLHVGLVMLAYTFGPLLFGWYGIFLGPLILVVVFEFARTLFPWVTAGDRSASTESVPSAVDDQSAEEESNAPESGSTAPAGESDDIGGTDGTVGNGGAARDE
ncbi:AI-2E family transporter [Halococcus saccharolyticus]|uniref:Htr-like protein n=1 Tax=Halococcus saccharolyticus DSM 5350 TaxID=1227455 RepID=M0MTW2_9EURY|nr:AI-2E family transporter [Halococcus saccharolyticus]EMA47900.1 Htr-like protein [Halococcus saccharolyticus DSM 5350]